MVIIRDFLFKYNGAPSHHSNQLNCLYYIPGYIVATLLLSTIGTELRKTKNGPSWPFENPYSLCIELLYPKHTKH